MALDFPDNPTDGEVYVASNGIQYTYNATTDSWTGALGSGSSYWSEVEDGSGNIYATDTNAFVGIGTDSPTETLDVNGTVQSDGAEGYFTVNRDVTAGTGALYLGFTQGVQKFKVGTDGIITFETLNLEDLADLPE